MKINITIVFYKDSKQQENFAKKLFKTLYRDFEKPLQKGLMIDTYFLKISDKNKQVVLDNKENEFYIFLVDISLALCYIENINTNNSFVVSYVNTKQLSKSKSFDSNFLYVVKDKEDAELGLFTFLAKKLYLNKKLTLFLSHTKRDGFGEKEAKNYNTFISNNTKLKTFIDINDISHGDNIEKEIDEKLRDAIFIGFESDAYSSSKWTQFEMVLAKRRNMPIILINCINKKVPRRFPYLGNSLVLGNTSIKDNIKEILVEAIRLKINEQRINYFCSLYDYKNVKFLNNIPELLDLQLVQEDEIVCPEPPITDIEENILEKSGKKIYTTLTYICKEHMNNNVGISISELNDNFDNGFENIHLYTAQEEIAKYLLHAKNKIVYGGDISYNENFNFVSVLADIADVYDVEYESIINHICYPLNKNIDAKMQLKYNNIIKFETFNGLKIEHEKGIMPYSDTKALISFSENLSLMRKMMAEKCDARIMLGGKHFKYLGKYPGLLEEAYYTLKAGKPLYLIGGFGGISRLIIDLIEGKEVEELTFEWQKRHQNNDKLRTLLSNDVEVDYDEITKTLQQCKLNNLSKQENEILFYSTSIEEIIFYILKGLKNG